MRAFRAGVPWPSTLHSWTLLDSHDTARFRTSQARATASRRHRPADDDARRADDLCRGRAGAGRRLGRGARRTMPWKPPGSWDTAAARRVPVAADRCFAAARRRSHAAGSATPRSAPTRSPSCASTAASACCASPRGPATSRSTSLAALGCAGLETLYGGRRASRMMRPYCPATASRSRMRGGRCLIHVWLS